MNVKYVKDLVRNDIINYATIAGWKTMTVTKVTVDDAKQVFVQGYEPEPKGSVITVVQKFFLGEVVEVVGTYIPTKKV